MIQQSRALTQGAKPNDIGFCLNLECVKMDIKMSSAMIKVHGLGLIPSDFAQNIFF